MHLILQRTFHRSNYLVVHESELNMASYFTSKAAVFS